MQKPFGLFAVAALLVVASWWWRGYPVVMPPSPLAQSEKLYCVSYAPFRGWQTPLDPTTVIPPAQIEEDLKSLAEITDCIRIYSVDLGLDRVPEIAQRHGLKVLLGVWISSETKRNEAQIKTGVALANRYAGTVMAMIVGNEVLLRGEITEADLAAYIRSVKQQVKVQVTYADVWEYWLKHRSIESTVDFVTVHILPYWEDEPIPAEIGASHIASIRAKVAQSFAGKDVIIGEAGWPSAGRMREGALPSPAAQARVIHDLVAAAKAGGFKVNLIEAFDQPWKRHLEGTVGGHWGLFSDSPRRAKFAWGRPVSNHPAWVWQALAGVMFAAAVFAAGRYAARTRGLEASGPAGLPGIAVMAAAGGAMLGAVIENAMLESLGPGGWMRSIMLVVLTVAAPMLGAAALGARIGLPAITTIIGPLQARGKDPIGRALGWVLIATCVMAMESALGLTFNPRYLDFPYASLTAAVVPLAVVGWIADGRNGVRPAAETVLAGMLLLCVIKIVWFETVANWQALWLCAAFLLLAFTLARARTLPG